MNSWSLLQKYYNLTDKNHGIYACATLLNPGLRKRHFIDTVLAEAEGEPRDLSKNGRPKEPDT